MAFCYLHQLFFFTYLPFLWRESALLWFWGLSFVVSDSFNYQTEALLLSVQIFTSLFASPFLYWMCLLPLLNVCLMQLSLGISWLLSCLSMLLQPFLSHHGFHPELSQCFSVCLSWWLMAYTHSLFIVSPHSWKREAFISWRPNSLIISI